MKKIVVLLAVLAVSCGSAFADVDFGVSLDTSTFLSGGVVDTTYYSQHKDLWGELFQETSKGGSLDLIAQGSYRYTADRPYVFDLDLLRFKGLFSAVLGEGTAIELTAGRFEFNDSTRLILDQTLDGIQVNFQFTNFQVRLAGAYSGFIINPSSNVRISADDVSETSDNSVFFGPKRVIAQAFIGSDGFGLEGLAQFDLRGSGAEIINTQYLGIVGVPHLFGGMYLDYNLTASYGQSTVSSKTTDILSALAGFGFRVYAEQLASSRAHLKVNYATGFTPLVLLLNNLSLDNFRPITQPTIGLAFSPQLANLLYVDFGYSFHPFAGNPSTTLANIEPQVGARAFFRDPLPLLLGGTAASLQVTDLNPGSNALYLGTEIDAGVAARVLSDLGVSVTGGVFVPSTGSSAAFSSSRGLGYVLKIDISAAI